MYLEELGNLNFSVLVQIDFVQQLVENTFIDLLVVFLRPDIIFSSSVQ